MILILNGYLTDSDIIKLVFFILEMVWLNPWKPVHPIGYYHILPCYFIFNFKDLSYRYTNLTKNRTISWSLSHLQGSLYVIEVCLTLHCQHSVWSWTLCLLQLSCLLNQPNRIEHVYTTPYTSSTQHFMLWRSAKPLVLF